MPTDNDEMQHVIKSNYVLQPTKTSPAKVTETEIKKNVRKPHFKKQITENVSAVATIRYDENQSAAGVAVYAEPKPK